MELTLHAMLLLAKEMKDAPQTIATQVENVLLALMVNAIQAMFVTLKPQRQTLKDTASNTTLAQQQKLKPVVLPKLVTSTKTMAKLNACQSPVLKLQIARPCTALPLLTVTTKSVPFAQLIQNVALE